MTSSGIEPAAFRLVAQCLNQLRHHVPPNEIGTYLNLKSIILWQFFSFSQQVQAGFATHPTSLSVGFPVGFTKKNKTLVVQSGI